MIFGSLKKVPWLVLAWGAFSAYSADTALNETRSALEKWVETRQLVSKTSADWQTDKEILEQTIQLFEREVKSIDEQMSKISTNNIQVEKERTEAEALKKSSTESLERARQFAEEFEGQVTKLVPQLPLPLQEILKPLLTRIPS